MMKAARLEVLPRSFAARDTVDVACDLLGQLLVVETENTRRIGRIVETEAYLGPSDLACHSSKGRTPRTEVMFGPPGHAYVFLIYGMHHCFNVVTGAGEAVLIRALEPVEGLRAGGTTGPGRLTAALGITRSHNSHPLDRPPLFLARAERRPKEAIARGPRVGVAYAGAWARRKLRFWIRGCESVSAH